MATKKRQLFDAAEYVKRMDLMITNLRKKTPGEAAGEVGKNEILRMRREELQQLVSDGYTVNQIAEAMKDDVFSILPKTITEIVKPKVMETETVTTTGKATRKTTGKATSTATVVATETKNIDATESTLNVEVNADKKNKTAAARNKPNNFVDI